MKKKKKKTSASSLGEMQDIQMSWKNLDMSAQCTVSVTHSGKERHFERSIGRGRAHVQLQQRVAQRPTLMLVSTAAAAAAEVGPLGPPQAARVIRVVRRRVHHARRRCSPTTIKVPFTISHSDSSTLCDGCGGFGGLGGLGARAC